MRRGFLMEDMDDKVRVFLYCVGSDIPLMGRGISSQSCINV